MYSRFVHFFPSLLLPALATLNHLSPGLLQKPLVSLLPPWLFMVHPLSHSLRDPLKCQIVSPLCWKPRHIQNEIQPLSQGLPGSRGLGTAFLCLTLYPDASVSTQESGHSSFFLCPSRTSIVLGTCQVGSCLRPFALALGGFSLLPGLPVADSIMPFRSPLSYCLFKEIAPKMISPFSHFLYNITIWNFRCFSILSPILEIKFWENEDLICPFHCQVGAPCDGWMNRLEHMCITVECTVSSYI